MLQITLTQKLHKTPINSMSSEELYEAGRRSWVLGARADSERFALIAFNNIVLQALEIERLEDEGGRRAIHGSVLGPGHPVYDSHVGRPAPALSTRNPIKYVSSDADRTVCRCGCGLPARTDFLPGHDQRAIHERIARIGTVAEFLDWFDRIYPTERS